MKKDNDRSSTYGSEEFKDGSVKHVLSKFEYDLYDEAKGKVVEKVIRVKKFALPNKGSKWKIMDDTRVLFIIEGPKLSKREREFLQTIEGFNFMLAQGKTGIKSLNAFRTDLKTVIDEYESRPKVIATPVFKMEEEKPKKKRGRPPAKSKKIKR